MESMLPWSRQSEQITSRGQEMKKWLLMALLMVSGLANAASELGKDYVLMAKPQPVANPKRLR
jgi:hypothetical protein